MFICLYCSPYFYTRQRLPSCPPQEITKKITFPPPGCKSPTYQGHPAGRVGVGMRLEERRCTGRLRAGVLCVDKRESSPTGAQDPSSHHYSKGFLPPPFGDPSDPSFSPWAGTEHRTLPLLTSPSVKGQSCIKSNFLVIRTG